MKRIIFCIILHIIVLINIPAIAVDDYFFDTAIEIGYARGRVYNDVKDTNPLSSDHGFYGKLTKYKFILPENQDVAIHHFGSSFEDGSTIHLYKLLEPSVPYEHFENGQFIKIGTASGGGFNINNQEYGTNDLYYQTNRQLSQDRYIQYCNEKGLNPPNIKKFQPFIFAENLKKGTYYIVSEGCARTMYEYPYIYMENGILSTSIMYGNLSNPEVVKEETYAGKYSTLFSYTDQSRSRDYKGGALRHKFEITVPMDITVSHCGSEANLTGISLLDTNDRNIAASSDSPYLSCENEGQATFYKKQLPPGIYYVISTSNDSDMFINLSIQGYAEKTGSQEAPLALTSLGKNYVYIITPTIPLSSTSNITLDHSIQEITYYDGLGRIEQTIQRGASPKKEDIVSFQEYDRSGRESILWNPVSIGGSGKAYNKNEIVFQSSNLFKDTCSYSKPIYKASPLNRVVEQYGPGNDWHENNRRVKIANLTNVAGVDTLNFIHYKVTDISDTVFQVNSIRNYETAQLSVDRIENEDGSALLEFKNKLGQLVLTRKIYHNKANKELCDTYYIYDDFGNQRVVLPPMASIAMKTGSFTSDTNALLRDYAYLYQYDDRNRCIAKKSPGCDWVFYVYDKGDRLIFSQDGNQRKRNENEWSFNIPDAFGRNCISGVCTVVLASFSSPLKSIVVKAEWNASKGAYKGYSLSGIILTDPKAMLVNYYDDYSFLGIDGIPAPTDSRVKYDIDAEQNEGFGKRYAKSSKGLLTGTLTAIMDDSSNPVYLHSVMYYDNRGRLIQSKAANHLLDGMEKECMAYDFVGNLTKRKHIHSAAGKVAQTETYTYAYDHVGRLLTTKHEYKNLITTLVDNEYDELGRLKANKRNGKALLKTEYTYNIRSWMKSISGSLFHQTLYYNDKRSNLTNVSRYDGNISGIDWGVTNDKERGYDFSYDALSRLTNAAYLEGNVRSDKFSTSYSYDKHGNMLFLARYGNIGTTTYGMIDSLSLTYQGNQLMKVEDKGANPSLSMSMDFKDGVHEIVEYSYDQNGNQVEDLNKGISKIEYNYLNLPKQVTFSGVNNPVNKYVYSAGGKKLAVIHKSSTEKRTDYVGNMIYENGSLKRVLVNGGYIENGVYHFYFQDHLGNNRVVANADGTVVQSSHYYPYGMSFAEGTSADKQPYKYNSKELNTENGINLYDYEARQMDVVAGRFTSIDPMAEKYYSISPYVYVANNPMKYIDPTGMKLMIFKNGKYFSTEDDGKEEITGYNQRTIVNKNGNEVYTGADSFTFNDIELDRQALEGADMTLSFMTQLEVDGIMDKSGVKEQDVLSRWGYAARESNGGSLAGTGRMDYKLYLSGLYEKTMYVINKVGYNGPDAGNYLWGYGMGIMGFTSAMARTAAHANAWWSAKESNNEGSRNPSVFKKWFKNRSWTGDSSADQRAIQNGLNDSGSYWTAKNKSIKKLWK